MTATEGLANLGLIERDPVHLAQTVQDMLSEFLRRPVVVEELSRSVAPMANRAPAEVLTATLRGGEEHRLFLKSIGNEEGDHPDKQPRDREPLLYRSLFAGRAVPVPTRVGGGWNEAIGRHDLYLEHIDDWDLRYQEVEYWYLAAARLGHLHRAFAQAREELLASEYLLRFDAAHFQAWAYRALEAVRRQSTDLARRYERVVRAFGRGGELLAAQPPTLVHNDLSGKNVLVDRSVRPARICFIDWEMAGIGCGLLDLAHLKYGFGPAEQARLCAAYYEAVRGSDLLPSQAELTAVLAACEIHETNVRLWLSPRWSLPEGRLAEWVDDTEAAIERIF
ncbi:Phosphotransferase enzyme family protein [Micromonospora rhizosphaerae]|uniref:Phosphotransferase enzyme family protein n=1 Tax=Micromonospora rhizosphaerae TaxID=568872 RepID=A0A1C6SRU9_9ACTN|nr:aminoglycoside phosphotransferase family protein [Micromonospora rhizosphaerae]SCL32271.1 Phosphotransferase enzyme family protein [Micromonospora rhizosphaerae]